MPPQQRTILLVDDDHEILESMRTVLENKGFRILAARDGNAGLMIAEREDPDLLILDMMMPKKSGFLVLEKLRSRPGGLIPTIMITGNEGSRHRAYAEMLGVRDYIRKPFAMEKLVRAVEKVMGVKPRPGELGDDDLRHRRRSTRRRASQHSGMPCCPRLRARTQGRQARSPLPVRLRLRCCSGASQQLRPAVGVRGAGGGAAGADRRSASPTTPIISIASNGSTVLSFSTSGR